MDAGKNSIYGKGGFVDHMHTRESPELVAVFEQLGDATFNLTLGDVTVARTAGADGYDGGAMALVRAFNHGPAVVAARFSSKNRPASVRSFCSRLSLVSLHHDFASAGRLKETHPLSA